MTLAESVEIAKGSGIKLGFKVAKKNYPRSGPKALVENLVSHYLDLAREEEPVGMWRFWPAKAIEAFELGQFIGIKKFLNEVAGVSVPRAFETGFRKGLKKRWGN
jgi:hypothetical protein